MQDSDLRSISCDLGIYENEVISQKKSLGILGHSLILANEMSAES